MYRCGCCDTPAQQGHHQQCFAASPPPSNAPATPPWDWPDDEHKLDIQSGMRMPSREQEALMA